MISNNKTLIFGLFMVTAFSQEVKWMSIGDLHNWYSAAGCEIETGRTGQVSDQQDGLRYPAFYRVQDCLLYTSPSPRDRTRSRMPSSA